MQREASRHLQGVTSAPINIALQRAAARGPESNQA